MPSAITMEFGARKMDTMINTTPILTATLILVLSAYSSADELTDAAQGLCDTIKTCALEAVDGPDLSDELREMMDPVLEKNCAEMSQRVQALPADHNLFQPAVGCLRSMASLSCKLLHIMNEIKTPECAEYDGLLKAASTMAP